jgi:hypothetical protein
MKPLAQTTPKSARRGSLGRIAKATEKSRGIRFESTGCIPGAPHPRPKSAAQAPPGSIPAGPEAAFGGPVRRAPRPLPRLLRDSVPSATSQVIGRLPGIRIGTMQFSVSSVVLCVLCVSLFGGHR